VKILLVTNDFPPRVGGIQSYLANIYGRLAAHDEITVLAPAFPGDVAHDRAVPFEVVRWPTRVYWPAASLGHKVGELAAGKDVLAFGAVLPMNLIGRRIDLPYVVHTHGFEVAWARVPALVQLLRRIGRGARLVTVVSDYTARFIERALYRTETRIEMLKTGVDLERFHPDVDGGEVRKRHGLGGRPLVVCVSRLVARKGQDTIVKALRVLRREIPDAAALLVGGGPARPRLERLAGDRGVSGAVTFAGEVREAELPAYYAAGDVFAMPCRSRWGRLEVEGLGLVYLEAQACGRPAIAGDSGGAPEAVVPGVTGFVVPGDDHRALAQTLADLLGDPGRARRMGEAARAFVEERHHWDRVVERYRGMLEEIAR
jgi:phosphatidylinositol alpha-1,6-mannosyltransferase